MLWMEWNAIRQREAIFDHFASRVAAVFSMSEGSVAKARISRIISALGIVYAQKTIT